MEMRINSTNLKVKMTTFIKTFIIIMSIPNSTVFSDTNDLETIQGMEQHPPLYLSVVTIEKGAFGSPSTKFANFPCFQVTIPI